MRTDCQKKKLSAPIEFLIAELAFKFHFIFLGRNTEPDDEFAKGITKGQHRQSRRMWSLSSAGLDESSTCRGIEIEGGKGLGPRA